MRLHLFSASKLADDIANERLSQRDKANYMLAGLIFGALVGYSPFTFTNSGQSWLGLYECLSLLAVTVYGFERSYTAANGDSNRSFIPEYVCLALPVGVTTTVIAWGLYWAGWHTFQRLILGMSFESDQAAKMMLFINNELPRPTVFLTVTISTAIFFLRIALHLKRINILRSTASESEPSSP